MTKRFNCGSDFDRYLSGALDRLDFSHYRASGADLQTAIGRLVGEAREVAREAGLDLPARSSADA